MRTSTLEDFKREKCWVVWVRVREELVILFLNIWHLNQMRIEQISTYSEAQIPSHQPYNLSQSALKTARSYPKLQKRIRKRKTKRTSQARTYRVTTDASQTPESIKSKINSQLEPSTSSFLQIQEIIGSALAVHEISDQFGQMTGYLGTITDHLLEKQKLYSIPPSNYTSHFGQPQKLRLIQLMGVQCMRLGLRAETQFLAIDIFHRICTATSFERYHSALKAASSLYVAAKYEQVCAPKAMLFCGLDPGQQVLAENIVKLQGLILLHLDFNLSFATSLHFAQLLALRFGLRMEQRLRLLGVCRLGVQRQQLWVGRGSLLAMAGLVVVEGRVAAWEQCLQLWSQLQWRVKALRELVR